MRLRIYRHPTPEPRPIMVSIGTAIRASRIYLTPEEASKLAHRLMSLAQSQGGGAVETIAEDGR